MGLFDRFRKGASAEESKPAQPQRECVHGTMVARWAQVSDMGDNSKATEWICQSCDKHFSPDEADVVRKAALERLRR